ncbi:TrbC/VirB2 family protein [Azohydromonas aeria]|uniref:TrbC/VirB2 family protein n=1 Tax=Azohydromonas aeria TaxID=2590212 RepID=UPI0012F8A1D3|nr:TrbC/VirB2 family protein [Azohydromonas aeria]
MSTRRAATKTLSALVLLAASSLAHAGLPDINTRLGELNTWLLGAGIGLFTASIIWTGYKMAFAGAQFRDCSNILWGGVLAAGGATIASWLFT